MRSNTARPALETGLSYQAQEEALVILVCSLSLKFLRTSDGSFITTSAVQYARVRGLRVIAVDTGDAKKELCLKLGAEKWIDFMECKDIVAEITSITNGGAHSAVVTSANGAGYRQAVDYLRPGGTLMAVGLPGKATLEASIWFTVFKSISILGSYVGNRQDAVEAINIAARGQVKVHFTTKPLKELENVYEGMKAGKIAGRIILDLAQK